MTERPVPADMSYEDVVRYGFKGARLSPELIDWETVKRSKAEGKSAFECIGLLIVEMATASRH